ncbi:MAG TPA: MFS transporter [Burkholderiaceae bacterium]|nr:MFS transporter [Burkholderiaceae bacterium]
MIGTATPVPAPAASFGTIAVLGIAQIISWGSLYYAFSFLITPLMEASGADKPTVFAAFSLGLLVSGVLSAPIGALIDRLGGRGVMTAGSVAGGVLLACLSQVQSIVALYAVWAGLGAVMAATLYDPAFAVITRMFATNYRRAITALTLFGGFASTVFWPLTQFLIAEIGWRQALLVLAALNFAVCAPLHWWVLPRDGRGGRTRAAVRSGSGAFRTALRTPVFYLLTIAFTGNSLVFSATQVHLMSMLQAKDLSAASAAAVGAMIGPMQVTGRVLELAFASRLSASAVGILSMAFLPIALWLLSVAGVQWPLLVAFAVIYGIGNGAMTIVRGAIPAELFGRDAYGAINGAMAAPVTVAKAAGPLVAALLFASLDGYDRTLLVLIVIGVISTAVFVLSTRASSGRRPGMFQ